MPEVQILRRVEAERPDESGAPKPVTSVTYSTAAIPPRTVIIPGHELSDSDVAAAVAVDLELAETGPAPTLQI